MAEPVNLNRYRKAKARVAKKAQADENAAKFGQTKAVKSLEDARKSRSESRLDQHKLDG